MNKNYIKMCEKAEEIQKQYKECKAGDFLYDINGTWGREFVWHDGLNNNLWEWVQKTIKDKKGLPENKYHLLMRNWIWLPTQEQLQGMINLDPVTLICLIDKFVASGEGYWHSFTKSPYPNPTMTEFWLALVMKEKYNKIWNGKTWVIA